VIEAFFFIPHLRGAAYAALFFGAPALALDCPGTAALRQLAALVNRITATHRFTKNGKYYLSHSLYMVKLIRWLSLGEDDESSGL
jgi:hypothetical protein